jgi:Fe-S oxidoreductase
MTEDNIVNLQAYETYLHGCRFCPMCKPFGEVSNLTQLESHTTRLRGMFLWSIIQSFSSWTDRLVELMYETTLDSVSQAWCVSDYPVPEIILAARADIVDADLAPDHVVHFKPPTPSFYEDLQVLAAKGETQVLFYPGDAIAAASVESALSALRLLRSAERSPGLAAPLIDCGGLALCLGLRDLAQEQAEQLLGALEECTELIVDGPLSLWMFEVGLPSLDMSLPESLTVTPLSSLLLQWIQEERLRPPRMDQKAYLLGSEFSRLTKRGFEPLQKLAAQISGLQVVEPVGGLKLADGSGVGGALHIAAPELADRVSDQRIEDALTAGAQILITDSPLDADHLRRAARGRLAVRSLPEVLELKG